MWPITTSWIIFRLIRSVFLHLPIPSSILVFRVYSGPSENNDTLIRPHAALVFRYYESHVSSKCITLQQDSHPLTRQRQIHMYDLCTSTSTRTNTMNYWRFTMYLWTILPKKTPSFSFYSFSFSVALKAVDQSWQCASLLLIFYITSLFNFM